jgi:hypothetical protein
MFKVQAVEEPQLQDTAPKQGVHWFRNFPTTTTTTGVNWDVAQQLPSLPHALAHRSIVHMRMQHLILLAQIRIYPPLGCCLTSIKAIVPAFVRPCTILWLHRSQQLEHMHLGSGCCLATTEMKLNLELQPPPPPQQREILLSVGVHMRLVLLHYNKTSHTPGLGTERRSALLD